MLDHRSVSQNVDLSLENVSTKERTVDDLNNQKSDEKSSSEKEISSEELFQVELISDESSELMDNVCGEEMRYAWKIGGVIGSFFSNMTYCLGYIIDRDLVVHPATHFTIPYVSSVIAPPIVGGFSYLLSSNQNFKEGCKSFVLSGVTVGVMDSLTSTLYPDMPYTPATLVIASLTTLTILNIVTPEICLSMPTVCNKIAKMTDNCFSLFRPKSHIESQPGLNEVGVNEKTTLMPR